MAAVVLASAARLLGAANATAGAGAGAGASNATGLVYNDDGFLDAAADAWCTLWSEPCEVVCDPNEALPPGYSCREAAQYFVESKGLFIYMLIGILACMSCLFNTLMIIGIVASKKIDQMSFLIGHQTITDIVFSYVCTPTFLIILSSGRWMAGRAECSLVGFFIHQNGCATILSLATITFVRWRSIVPFARGGKNPVPYEKSFLNKVYVGLWLFSTCYAAIPMLSAA